MEMARITLRLTRGRLPALAAALAIGVALTSAGCGKPICPPGMRADAKRSNPGQNAFCVNPTDIHQAAFVDLHPNGAQRQACPFVDGKPSGLYRAFHPGGERWLEGRYENGLKVGRWTQWAADGRKVADGEYREGLMIEGAPVGFPATCERVTW
jgi:hypothetical protein